MKSVRVAAKPKIANGTNEVIAGVMKLSLVGVTSLILLGACGEKSRLQIGERPAAEPIEQPVPVLQDLTGVDQFKAAFNEDGGLPRLILLLSPT